MASIADLLKYKTDVKVVNPKNNEVLKVFWIKIMGDEAVKEAYKFARVASSNIRHKLEDKTSVDYIVHITSLEEQDDKDLYDLILSSKINEFSQESVGVVARGELPKIEEVAVDPDAPTLPEQEKLDVAEQKVDQDFMDKINAYVEERKVEFEAKLKKTPRKKLVELAQEQMKLVIPIQAFMEELENQKGYRGTFMDKECKTKAYDSIEEFRDAATEIKTQILDTYHKLELGPDEIKN